MHAKPFGYGDGDSHVVINHTDPRFAVENLDFDPDSYDDRSQRLKSEGKVSRMRTSAVAWHRLSVRQLAPAQVCVYSAVPTRCLSVFIK